MTYRTASPFRLQPNRGRRGGRMRSTCRYSNSMRAISQTRYREAYSTWMRTCSRPLRHTTPAPRRRRAMWVGISSPPSSTAYPTEPLLPDSFSLPIAFDTETPVISTFPLPELDIDQPDGAITVPSALTAQRRLVGMENVIFCSAFSGTAPYAAAGATREAAATAIEATARKALPAPFRQQARDKFSITILIDSITSATTESR